MIWWSTVLARVLSALLALVLKRRVDRQDQEWEVRTNVQPM